MPTLAILFVGVAVMLVIALWQWRQLQRTTAAREAAEAHARALVEACPLPIWAFDLDTLEILDVNGATVAGYGWSRDELLRMTVRDIRPPENVAGYEALLKTMPPVSHTLRTHHRRKDGSVFDVEVHSCAMTYRGRRARFAVAEDITARIQTEESLRQSEARFRAMVDASPAGVVLATVEGKVGYANDAVLKMIGRSLEDCLDRGWIKGLHPEDRDRVVRSWAEAAGKGQPFTQTGRFLHGDGRVVWWSVRTTPIRVHDRVIGQVAVLVDETERRRAEDALRESEARFRQLADNIPGVVYLIDPRRNEMLYIGPRYETIWGRTTDSLYANPRSFLEAVHPDDRSRVEAAYRDRRERLTIEYRIARPDGREVWVEDIQFPIKDAAGHLALVAGLVFDTTNRHRLEEQLVQSQKMESLGRLAGGVAHDFNNLLTVILSYADLLKESAEDETQRMGLGEIESASRRAAALTRQLLSFARRQIFEPKPMDANQFAEGVDEMLRRVIGEDVRVEVKTTAGPATVRVDPHQLEQVLINLALNARYAMPAGGTITLATGNLAVAGAPVTAVPVDIPPGHYVSISVSDTGAGIPPELQAKVFEPFFTTKPKGEGAGLGLSTSFGIISQFGGYLALTSAQGRGTTVTCYLPVVESEEKRAAQAAAAAGGRGHETVLVVEDEPMVREVAKRTLVRQGYDVLTAGDGVEGLRVAAACPTCIHLLVTDVVMPNMGGRQLAAELKRVRPDTRVLFTSGYNEELATGEGRLEEGVDFLPKPYVPGTLAARVRQMLDAK